MIDSKRYARLILRYINKKIPHSATRLSLNPSGYPVNGPIHEKIEAYRAMRLTPFENATYAIETGCGNCQEMAYAGARELLRRGYKGYIAIGQFGINHQFLFVGNLIVDLWSRKYYRKNYWRYHMAAYGGSIKNGVVKGRLLPAAHEELEDEVPEVVEVIQNKVKVMRKPPSPMNILLISQKATETQKLKVDKSKEEDFFRSTYLVN